MCGQPSVYPALPSQILPVRLGPVSASRGAASDRLIYIRFANARREVQGLFGPLLSVPSNAVPPECIFMPGLIVAFKYMVFK